MSLTSELSKRTSPVAQYLRFVGAIVADASRGAPSGDEFKRLLGLSELDVSTVVMPVDGAAPQMVGTAFDYRLRYHLAPCESRDLVAWSGAAQLTRSDPTTRPLLLRFFSNLDALTARSAPTGRALDDEEERLLDGYCVVLAQLEAVYRTGGGWVPELPNARPRTRQPEDEPLLALAPQPTVADVVDLSRSARRVFGELIQPVADGTLPYQANPVFAGSIAIGGADADFVIGDTVFELKTTKSFKVSAVRAALLQLLGYSLLDYDDRFAIRRLGVYFARQEWVAAWPLWHIIFPPAEVVQHALRRSGPTDDEVAERLVKLRSLMRRAVDGEAIDYTAEFS